MGYLMEMIDRDIILDRRSKGMTMYDIAAELWDNFHHELTVSPSTRRKEIDQLITMNGGVYDICMDVTGQKEEESL